MNLVNTFQQFSGFPSKHNLWRDLISTSGFPRCLGTVSASVECCHATLKDVRATTAEFGPGEQSPLFAMISV